MGVNDLGLESVVQQDRPQNADTGYSGHLTDILWHASRVNHRGILCRNHFGRSLATGGSVTLFNVPLGYQVYVEAVLMINVSGVSWGTQIYSLGTNAASYNNWNNAFQIGAGFGPGLAKYLHPTNYGFLNQPAAASVFFPNQQFRIRKNTAGSDGTFSAICLGWAIAIPRVKD